MNPFLFPFVLLWEFICSCESVLNDGRIGEPVEREVFSTGVLLPVECCCMKFMSRGEGKKLSGREL